MTVPKYANPVALLAAAALYATACLLPGEPSDAERVVFTLDFEQPYRVPLAGAVEPPIRIAADGQVLQAPNYRLESLDPSLVRVDPTGRGLQGAARGTAAVRVIYQTASGAPDTVFSVQVVVSRIAVGPPVTSFTRLGVSTPLSATAYDALDATVPSVAFTWSSTDPQVATVNDTGLVRAVDEGIVAITAEADGVEGLASVTVTQVAAQVRLAPELDTLRTVGRSAQFIALALDEAGRVLQGARPRWTTSTPIVATVDGAGLVTAAGAGTARIIARVGEAADTATLVVAQVIRILVVTPGSDTLTAIADTGRVVALAFDSLNFPIPNPSVGWATSDAAVATVDQGGLVRAERNGVVLATATSGGHSAFATIVVRQEVSRVQISPDNVALTGEGATVQLSAEGLDRNGYPVAGPPFSWRSGSECVATVNSGLVTARGGGETAIIAAPANGGQGDTATVTVTGAPQAPGLIAFESPQGIEMVGCEVGRKVLIGVVSGSNWPSPPAEPEWSPDGASLAYTRCAIHMARSDGSEERPVNSGGSYECDYSPTWSPDGRIAFSRAETFGYLIYVLGSDKPLEGSGHFYDTDPTWSPDGTKLAFAGGDGIYVMDADGDGSDAIRLTPFGGEPSWSPDSSELAFVHQDDIWLMNADGSNARHLPSTNVGFERTPAWSPDGAQIVFVSGPSLSIDGLGDVYLINRDGSALRRLTSTGDVSNPSWGPAPLPAGLPAATGARRGSRR